MIKTVRSFFNNSQLPDVIPKFLEKLKKFNKIIRNATRFRFFGSSLLLIYDGSGHRPDVEVRMIDFANTCHSSSLAGEEDETPNTPDAGYLKGLQSLIDILNGS